jgi:ATP-binding cassette subfamily B protein
MQNPMDYFKQQDLSDCGVVCLHYICHHYKLKTTIAKLRQLAGTDTSGTTALGLVEAAEPLGFYSKGIKCAPEDLMKVVLPAIAHINTGHGMHYVVLCSVGKKSIKWMDPAIGREEKYPRDKFIDKWSGVIVIMAPGVQFNASKGKQSSLRNLFGLLWQQKAVIMQLFVGAVVATLIGLANTVFIQKVMDNVISAGNRNLLSLLGFAMIGVVLLQLFLGYAQRILSAGVAQKIDVALISGYYKHLLMLPYAFYNTMRVGEITSRVRDAYFIRDFITSTILSLFLSPLILVCAYGLMFFYSSTIALYSLSLFPIYILLYLSIDWLNCRFQREIMEKNAAFDAHLVETLHAVSLIKYFQLEPHMGAKAENRLVSKLRTAWAQIITSLNIGTAAGLVTQIYGVGLIWIGATQVLDSKLTAGQLMACLVLSQMMTTQFSALIGLNSSLRKTLVSMDRVYEIMDLVAEEDRGASEVRITAKSKIEIQYLIFKYPGRPRVLKGITTSFKAGEVTLLTGPSGCGKSTLFALIQRQYRPESGRISIDGIEISNYSLKSQRQAIGIVPQKVELLAGTVLENIAPGDKNPDLHKAVRLCREIGILDFIESLPKGFQTILMEGGNNFSGGQRQRLAIVRALYSNPSIILMDEPSSALDNESEKKLIKRLGKLKKLGRIVIISAHSSRYKQFADKIILMESGKIISDITIPSPVAAPALEAISNLAHTS